MNKRTFTEAEKERIIHDRLVYEQEKAIYEKMDGYGTICPRCKKLVSYFRDDPKMASHQYTKECDKHLIEYIQNA